MFDFISSILFKKKKTEIKDTIEPELFDGYLKQALDLYESYSNIEQADRFIDIALSKASSYKEKKFIAEQLDKPFADSKQWEILEELNDENPQDIDILIYLSENHCHEAFDHRLENAEKALKIDPLNVRARLAKIVSCRHASYDISHINIAVEVDGILSSIDDPSIKNSLLRDKAKYQWAHDDNKNALKTLKLIKSPNQDDRDLIVLYDAYISNNPETYNNHILNKYQSSQIDRSIAIKAGSIFEDKGEIVKALEAYTKATKITPNYGDAWYHRANLYFKMEEYDKALNDLQMMNYAHFEYSDAMCITLMINKVERIRFNFNKGFIYFKDITDKKALTNVDIAGLSFNEVHFRGVIFKSVKGLEKCFNKCHFINHSRFINITSYEYQNNASSFEQHIFNKCTFTDSFFSKIKDEKTSSYQEYHTTQFSSSIIRGSKFINCDFKESTFSNCRFRDTSFEKSTFEKAIFYKCLFEKIDFTNVNLSKIEFKECTFSDCIFTNTILIGAKISIDSLASISLTDKQLNEIHIVGFTENRLKKENELLLLIKDSVLKLQERSQTIQIEDLHNDNFIDYLQVRCGEKIHLSDQNRSGISAKGKDAGLLDFSARDPETKTIISIIEALKVQSIGSKNKEISKHISKLLDKYDMNGQRVNYLLIYSELRQFNKAWKNYITYINNINKNSCFTSNNSLIKFEELDFLIHQTNVRVAVAYHKREGKVIELFHFFIDMAIRS